MKKHKSLIWISVLTLCIFIVAAQSFAGIGKRRGTASAAELLIPVGSRGTALSGAVSASISGAEAMYWNPAGIAASSSRAEVIVSHLTWLAGINVDFAAAYANFSGIGAFGVSIKSVGFGDIPVTTEQSPDGTGEIFSPAFMTIGLSYSRAMTDRIMAGANIKVISEKIMREQATGYAFDFGLQYLSPAGVRIGIVLNNLGPDMQYDGSDTEYLVEIPGTEAGTRSERLRVSLAKFELPTTLEIGLSYDLKVADKNMVTISSAFLNNNFGLDNYKFACEYAFQKMVFLRGGYSLAYSTDSGSFYTADEDNYLFGPSFGAGFNYNITSGMKISLDYAWRQAQLFDDNQWFTLTLKF